MNISRIVLMSFFCVVAAYGQAVVEHAVLTTGASSAAAGAGGVGKSIGGVFRSLSETVDKAATADGKASVPAPVAANPVATQAKTSAKPVPVTAPIDPSKITDGLDSDTVIKMFGEPLLRLSEIRKNQFVERLWYKTKSGQIEITLIEDKVALSRPPATAKDQADARH